MLLVREERLEGEGAVVRGNAQVMVLIGEPGVKEGEVGGVTPQGATWAVLGLQGVRWSEAGRVGSREGVVHCELECSGGSAPGVLGLARFAAHFVLLDFNCCVPEGVVAARWGIANGVSECGII